MKTAKPELKAYQLNTVNLDSSNESIARGYVMDALYGKTEHDARRVALKMCFDHNINEIWSDEPLTYTNIRIKRWPEMDKYLVDGKLKTQSDIDHEKRVAENDLAIKKMLIDNPGGHAYIRKGGYYYCANFAGYTERQDSAGVYTIEQAVNECLGMSLSDYMRPQPIDKVVHNSMIQERIEHLKTQLLA